MPRNRIISLFIIACVLLGSIVSPATYAGSSEYEDRVWISIDRHAYEQLLSSDRTLLAPEAAEYPGTEKDAVIITSVAQDRVLELSQLMHEHFKRCGGFIAYKSLAHAKTSLSAPLKSLGMIGYSIDNPDAVNSLLSQLSTQILSDTVTHLGTYYNRYYQSSTGVESAQWLASHWQSIAEEREDIQIEVIQHSRWPQPSVMVTIEGTSLPDEYVVIGGHLDSINSRTRDNGHAPGMDDNASGIGVITGLLEMVIRSDFYPARTVKLFGYAAEEIGLLGSSEIANSYRINNANIVGVSQFDMTGYNGTPEVDFVFISDYTDAAQNDFLAALVDSYLPGMTYIYDICGYACSDHAAWTNAGYRASFPFEARFQDSNPLIHTAADDYVDVSHMAKYASLAATYVAELAKGEAGDPSARAVLSIENTALSVNGGQSIDIVVKRVGRIEDPVTVDYMSANVTAVAGTDYTAVAGTLSWEAGDNSARTVTIQTNASASNGEFSFSLVNPSETTVISSAYQARVVINATTQATPPPTQASPGQGGSGSTWLLIALLLLAIFWPEPGRRRRKEKDND